MGHIIVDNYLLDYVPFSPDERRLVNELCELDDEADLHVYFCDDCRTLNPDYFIIKDEIWREVVGHPLGHGMLCVTCYAKRRGADSIDELLDDFDPDVPITQISLKSYGTPYTPKPCYHLSAEHERVLEKYLPELITWDARVKECLAQYNSPENRRHAREIASPVRQDAGIPGSSRYLTTM